MAPLDASPKTASANPTSTTASAEKDSSSSKYWMLIALLPTILTALHYGIYASDRYVSEAQFVIRTAAKPLAANGAWGSLLKMSGLSRSNDDVYAVQSFMASRDAIHQLSKKLPLREMYRREEADTLSRYPSLMYGETTDEFHRYFNSMVKTTFGGTTGIMRLRVQAFRPQDAQVIAKELLTLGEQTVNRFNSRVQNDAMRASQTDVKNFEERLITAQIAITRFRNSELVIDPAGSSLATTALIARLSAEGSQIRAQIREMTASAPDNPSLQVLHRRVQALDEQVRFERLRISDVDSGLAQKLARYGRLILEREFAKAALLTARKSLQQASIEGRRQQLYLERIVEPNLPDYPLEPQRLKLVWTVFGLNIIALLMGWLFWAGISQHRAGG